MDGLRYGMPVIVHEVSARGYEPFHNRSMFVYGDPDSFSDALDRMLDSDVDRSLIREIYSLHFFRLTYRKPCDNMTATP
jgi:hypothetical protein